MRKPKRERATVILPWSTPDHQGLLVHANRDKNTWIFPGGRIEQDQHELPIAAAIRELYEETGLIAEEVKFLFTHEGGFYHHHVFAVRASGMLKKIIDRKEAPAFAVCGPDLQPHVFLCERGYDTAPLVLSGSTTAIMQRAYKEGFLSMTSTPKHEPDGTTATPSASTTGPHPSDTPTSEPAGTTGASLQPRIIADEPDVLRVIIGTSILELTGGNIVIQAVDAVVNAANDRLANGGGVSGAIHDAAGVAELTQACRRYKGCPTGEARITPGFKLKAKHIIHAVGPIYADYQPAQADELLSSAYRASLALATEHKLRSIAFPSLSTGIYGFPVERAAPLAMRTIIAYLTQHQDLELVRFVLWKDNLAIYRRALTQELAKG